MEDKKELKCIFNDTQKSFYNKASYTREEVAEDLFESVLYSYNSKVAIILTNYKDKEVLLYLDKNKQNDKKFYSQTTLRHIKEFVKQTVYGLPLNYDLITDNYKKNNIAMLLEKNITKKQLFQYAITDKSAFVD